MAFAPNVQIRQILGSLPNLQFRSGHFSMAIRFPSKVPPNNRDELPLVVRMC